MYSITMHVNANKQALNVQFHCTLREANCLAKQGINRDGVLGHWCNVLVVLNLPFFFKFLVLSVLSWPGR